LRAAARGSVISGGIRKESGSTDEQAYNVVISSDTPLHTYAKRRLVPFAESVPLSDWIPGFRRFTVPSGGISSYARGDSLLPIPFAGQHVVPLICFESLFVQDAREALLAGGTMLIVTTQDGWWGSDLPRRQHLAFSRMLAASTGHPVAHATVDGHSGLIDAEGQLASLFREHPRALIGNIPLTTKDTLFMKMGNRPFFSIMAVLAMLLSLSNRAARTLPVVGEPLS
jgi:apolipoprotein N-acyltransferase